MSLFSESERAFLKTQPIGRLATVDAAGRPQNNPVAYVINAELGTIDIGGMAMSASRKFRNVLGHPQVSFVIDALLSAQPWTVAGIEIRGDAEALADVDPPMPGMSREIIRIRPGRIITWGMDPDQQGLRTRVVG